MNHVKNHREFTLYGASLQSMAAGDVAPVTREVAVKWTSLESVPVVMANQFLAQADVVEDKADLVILTIGQVISPAMLGSEADRAAQLRDIKAVSVAPLARFSLTPARLDQLIGLLTQVQQAIRVDDTKAPAADQAVES